MSKENLFKSKIDKQSRIIIPREILKKADIKLNSMVIIECQDNNTICISPKKKV